VAWSWPAWLAGKPGHHAQIAGGAAMRLAIGVQIDAHAEAEQEEQRRQDAGGPVRNVAEPRAPNTVADAPLPKPEPASAPAPFCSRISTIIAAAIRM
jgi:hypothetical protein